MTRSLALERWHQALRRVNVETARAAGLVAALGACSCAGSVADEAGSGGPGASSGAGGTAAREPTGGEGAAGGVSSYDLPIGGAPSGGAAQSPAEALTPWLNPFDACVEDTLSAEPYGPVLMFVVDASGSMTQPAPGSEGSKWEVTRDALSEVALGLPPSAAMGLLPFPNMQPVARDEPTEDPSDCVDTDAMVEPQPMDHEHSARLLDALENVEGIGGTPTPTALEVGLQALRAARDRLPGDAALVLMTDGVPTFGTGCVGDGTILPSNRNPAHISDALAAIGEAHDLAPPIPTFVIGAPAPDLATWSADTGSWLSDAAAVGGTAQLGCSREGPVFCHVDLTDPNTSFRSALTAALAEILGRMPTCHYSALVPPVGMTELDPALVKLKFVSSDGAEYRVFSATEEDCEAGSQGFFFHTDGSLSLCEATCLLLRADPLASVEIRHGCDAMI